MDSLELNTVKISKKDLYNTIKLEVLKVLTEQNIVIDEPSAPWAWLFDPQGPLGDRKLTPKENINMAYKLVAAVDPTWDKHIKTVKGIEFDDVYCGKLFATIVGLFMSGRKASQPETPPAKAMAARSFFVPNTSSKYKKPSIEAWATRTKKVCLVTLNQ